MIARRVFLSRLLEPNEAERAQSVLREIDKDVVFAQSLDEDPQLRIATHAEIAYEPSTATRAITPLCLFQMHNKKIDPFSFETKCNLVNLFLMGKSVSIVFFDASTKKRLDTMIEQMGGSVHEDEKVNFLVAPRPIEVEGGAIVVQACWIERLFGAKAFQSYQQFTFKKVEPTGCQSQIATPKIPSTFSFSQHARRSKPKRPPSSPRLSLKVTSPAQRNLGDFGIGIEEIRKPNNPKRSISIQSQVKPKLRQLPARSNSTVDDFFPKSSQSSQSSQHSQIAPPECDSYDDSELSLKLSGELLIQKEPKPEPPKQKKPRESIEDFLKKLKKAPPRKTIVQVSDDDDIEPPPSPKLVLQRAAGEPASLDLSLSSESDDEELKSIIKGVKSPKSKKLDDLVTRVLSSKPNHGRFIVEPPSDDKDAMLSQWVSFSQKDEDEPVTFDIDYDRDVPQSEVLTTTGRDPLFDLFSPKA